MAPKLTLEYDRVGDILYVQTCPPYRGQESDTLPGDMVGRFNPETGALECVEILAFTHRFARRRELALPFKVEVRTRRTRARRPPAGRTARSRRA